MELEYVSEVAEYLEYVTYSCPEGYMFEIHDNMPNENGEYGLIEDVRKLNLTCAEYGDWFPLEVPICISNFKVH